VNAVRAEKGMPLLNENGRIVECDELVPFADGELDASRADKFRDHLKACDDCRKNIIEHVDLVARLKDL
jgi:anti-sigma factor RsiW